MNPQLKILRMNDCPKCGKLTYTWGNVLPGQSDRRPGQYDDREREHRSCPHCGWSSASKHNAPEDALPPGVTVRDIRLPDGRIDRVMMIREGRSDDDGYSALLDEWLNLAEDENGAAR